MNVKITVRHTEVSDEVRTRTEALVSKLQKFDPRVSTAEVVFDEEKHLKSVEGILHVDRDSPVVATGEAADFLSAVDQMVERLAKILRRRRSQVTRHRGATRLGDIPEAEMSEVE